MRGVTLAAPTYAVHEVISTHTPRAGSDIDINFIICKQRISTHTPRAGSDLVNLGCYTVGFRFQPTLPVRGVTADDAIQWDDYSISTHTPRAGSDPPCPS